MQHCEQRKARPALFIVLPQRKHERPRFGASLRPKRVQKRPLGSSCGRKSFKFSAPPPPPPPPNREPAIADERSHRDVVPGRWQQQCRANTNHSDTSEIEPVVLAKRVLLLLRQHAREEIAVRNGTRREQLDGDAIPLPNPARLAARNRPGPEFRRGVVLTAIVRYERP